MLIEHTLFGVVDKVKLAIERLKAFEPPEGYYLATSFGKDSICVHELAKMAGVKFDAHFNFTGLDAPEVLAFGKKHYPDVIWNRPETSIWKLIVEKQMPPTRIARYCCEHLKEGGGDGRVVVTGVRWAESFKRSKRKQVEQCKKGGNKTYLHAIIEWDHSDVWEFIKTNKLPYPSLYDSGFNRIGCIGCPMAGKHRIEEFKRWPNFERAWKLAFKKCVEKRNESGKVNKPGSNWSTPEAMWKWWMEDCHEQDDPDQTIMFE